MKIIEGKQAVLRPYRTEQECVLPQRGQSVRPLEPVDCPITERKLAGCVPAEVQNAKMQEPVEGIFRRIPDAEMQKPVEFLSQSNYLDVSCVEVQAPIECIPQKLPETEQKNLAMENITIAPLQPVRAQVISASPEWRQLLDGTTSGMSVREKRKLLAENILHMTEEGGNI